MLRTIKFGLPGKAFQGAAFYAADNPPFGATITYYLKSDVQTQREKRREAEKEAAKKGQTVPYPNFDQLRADGATGVDLVSMLVLHPAGDEVPVGPRRVISRLGEQDIGHATAGREYRILAGPETGFRSGTHFVGYIPAGAAAPVHYHRYNEVIYVIEGEGILHIDGEHNPIRAGSCIHLPARVLHQIENTGDVPIREVAVFVPGGSPAAAYLPDGTSAYADEPDDPDR